jgi:tetratricopeptide (TPR) repeat protein
VAWAESRHVPPLEAAAGGVCVAAFLAALAWAYLRDRGLALVLALIPTTYVVVSGFPLTPQLYIAERFTYLPSAGACLAAGWVFVRIGRAVAERARSTPGGEVDAPMPRWYAAGPPGRVLTIVFVGVIAVLGVRSAVRNTDWKSDDTLMLSALAVAPDSPLALRRKGDEQYRLGNFDQARALLERSLELNPRRTEPYLILADIYRKQGDIKALVDLGLRGETHLSRYRALLHLGGALWQVGRREDAERLVGQVVRVYPDFVDARLTLGGLLLEGKRPEQALEQFRVASTHEPHNGLAWYGMARAANALGRLEDARLYADRARRAGLPSHVPADPAGAVERFRDPPVR